MMRRSTIFGEKTLSRTVVSDAMHYLSKSGLGKKGGLTVFQSHLPKNFNLPNRIANYPSCQIIIVIFLSIMNIVNDMVLL